MNKFKKSATRPRVEFWGKWEGKAHTLRYHPFNRSGKQVMIAAYANLVVSVQVSHEETAWGLVEHFWIRRHDSRPLTWREMQRIKNELAGTERVGIEVFPPVSELVDQANIYHLWVLPEGFTLPFSLKKSQDMEPMP